MKLETFFEKFELFADAPGAVAKMRALVLELAVRGQLSERNPEDQNDPAWQVFLEKFDNRIHGTDPGPPFDIPNEWRWVCVDDVADACGQKRPDEPFTYIDVASIDNQCGIIKSDLEVLTPENAPSRARKLVRLGTVIYATVRPYLKNIAIIDREFSPPAIVSTAFAVLHPRPFVDSRFLFFWLRSKPFEVEVAERMKGVAYPAINDGEFRSCPVPLPPLAEQKRIVAKVDELMALCDRLEAQQQERDTRHAALVRASLARFTEAPTPANLEFLFHPSYEVSPADLRKTILTLAVQGKLVPQDPNDEPALALLEKIATHKANLAKAGKFRGAPSVRPIANNEADFEIPENWCWVRFGDIMINRDGERIPVSKEERATKAKLYDYYDASGVIDKIDGYLFDKPLLLISEDGANLINRSTPIAFIARGKYWVNNHAHVLDGISEDFLRFIELHINAINIEKYVTGSAQPKMNQAKMNSIPIALPPLAEQRRIVAKVEQLMALVDELEQQLAASRATAEKLLTALVAELTSRKGVSGET